MTEVVFLIKTEQQDFLFSAKKATTHFLILLHEIGQIPNNGICSWHSHLTKQTNNLITFGEC